MHNDCQIKVNVQPEYIKGHSDPEKNHFVFAYHITISNHGKAQAQLLSRHWIITDANGEIEEVRGEGVIGEQPIIQVGGHHRYSSFCILKTPFGCMQGSFQMIDEHGESFNAPIAPFSLAIPHTLN
ncbi:MAG: Co2+/Mg2+ efflux protein ApaG [Mariprofundaceae bacterium]